MRKNIKDEKPEYRKRVIISNEDKSFRCEGWLSANKSGDVWVTHTESRNFRRFALISSGRKSKMKKIIEWWNEGGGRLIGFDDNGERMYSLTNGEMVILISVCVYGSAALLFLAKHLLTK